MASPLSKFLLSLCVAAVTGTAIHFTRPAKVKNEDSMVRDWYLAKKTHDTADVDLIIYGDSRVAQGVDPRAFLEVFPTHTPLNMGYSAAGFNDEMYGHLLRLSKGRESRMIIILGITPYGLTSEAMANTQFLEEWHRPYGDVQTRLQLYPLLGLFEPIAPSMYRRVRSSDGIYVTYHPDGWEETYQLPEDPGRWLPGYARHFKRTQVDRLNIIATLNFVRRCRSLGIAVYAYRPPSTREMEQIENSNSGFYEAGFIRAFEAAGGTWIHFSDRFAYYSYDGSHLDYKVAKRFSGDLARTVAGLHAEKHPGGQSEKDNQAGNKTGN